MLFTRAIRLPTSHIPRRLDTTTTENSGSFYYRYGTPLVKCAVLASATTLGWQLLWQNLEYHEYRDEAEAYVTKLEERLKTLEEDTKSNCK